MGLSAIQVRKAAPDAHLTTIPDVAILGFASGMIPSLRHCTDAQTRAATSHAAAATAAACALTYTHKHATPNVTLHPHTTTVAAMATTAAPIHATSAHDHLIYTLSALTTAAIASPPGPPPNTAPPLPTPHPRQQPPAPTPPTRPLSHRTGPTTSRTPGPEPPSHPLPTQNTHRPNQRLQTQHRRSHLAFRHNAATDAPEGLLPSLAAHTTSPR